MSKFLFFVSIVLIFTSQVEAQIVAACAMDHGSLVHSVYKKNEQLIGRFEFPSFRDLEKDPSGETSSLNASLTNDLILSGDIKFLIEKKNFLEKVFGDKSTLTVEFDFCEQQQSADKKFKAYFCFKTGSFEINGVALNRLEFSLQNQIRTSLVGSEGQVAQTKVAYADLLFTTAANKNGIAKAYRSSFTYYPNGNSVQCTWN